MKKILLLFLLCIVTASCTKKYYGAHVYECVIDGTSTLYTPYGDIIVPEPKVKMNDLGVYNDTSLVKLISKKTKEWEDKSFSYVKMYYDVEKNETETDKTVRQIKISAQKSALESLVGSQVMIISISDSIVQKWDDAQIANYLNYEELINDYKENVTIYHIYDGLEISSSMQANRLIDRFK